MRKTCLAISMVIVLLAAGCDLFDDDDGTPQPLRYEAIEQSSQLAIVNPGTAVFSDLQSWEAYWAEHSSTSAPVVDFDRNTLIAVFWGSGYSGCSSRVEAIVGIDAVDDVIVTEIGPLPNLGACEALVYPIEIVRVERRGRVFTFRGHVPG